MATDFARAKCEGVNSSTQDLASTGGNIGTPSGTRRPLVSSVNALMKSGGGVHWKNVAERVTQSRDSRGLKEVVSVSRLTADCDGSISSNRRRQVDGASVGSFLFTVLAGPPDVARGTRGAVG